MVENGKKVLYLIILKAIYGMLQASLLWYRKLRKDLQSVGFIFNVYDACVANRTKNKRQHTIRFHVDDILSSHVDPKVNDEFSKWGQSKYDDVKDVEVTRGKKPTFLCMVLDFGVPGVCHVIHEEHVEDIVSSWPEKLKQNDMVLTPALLNLFKKGGVRLLSVDQNEIFHSVIVKALFIWHQSRPDVMPAVGILLGRVHNPNTDDWEKGRRLVRYLNCTRDFHLVLRYDGFNICKWHLDASFAVDPNFCSHSGGVMFVSDRGGSMAFGRTKQKLNTRFFDDV